MVLLLIAATGLSCALTRPAAASASILERASVSTAGEIADGSSAQPAISADGRFVAFASSASNLVTGDAVRTTDVFVRDRRLGTTTRVSVPMSGPGAACPATSLMEQMCGFGPSISADGRHVAFASLSDDLVPGDRNGVSDVFVRDLATGTTNRVSVSSSGAEGNGFSGWDVPHGVAISSNGRSVAFTSAASNLVAGDTNGFSDVFVHDLVSGETSRVSVSSRGAQVIPQELAGVAISGSGRLVAFSSSAPDLVAHDTNGAIDVFVRDRRRGTTRRVNVSAQGRQANDGSYDAPSISADGRFVAFTSSASNLVHGDTNESRDVFVRDRRRRVTRRVSVNSRGHQVRCVDREEDSRRADCSMRPSISPDGRFVAFSSLAPGLVRRDTNDGWDYFLRDRAMRTTRRLNTSRRTAQQVLDTSVLEFPATADGFVAFTTAGDLLAGSSHGYDVFVRQILR